MAGTSHGARQRLVSAATTARPAVASAKSARARRRQRARGAEGTKAVRGRRVVMVAEMIAGAGRVFRSRRRGTGASVHPQYRYPRLFGHVTKKAAPGYHLGGPVGC